MLHTSKLFYRLILLMSVIFVSYFPLSAQNADDIIQKHIAAIGGKEAWSKLSSYEYKATVGTEGSSINLNIACIPSKSIKVDFKYSVRGNNPYPDKMFYVLMHKNQAVKLLPETLSLSPESLSDAEKNLIWYEYQLSDPFLDALASNNRIEWLNTEYFNDKFYHKFLVWGSGNKQEYIYLDPDTYLIHSRVLNDPNVAVEKEYLSHRKLPMGIIIADEIESASGIFKIGEIRVNIDLKESAFTIK